MADKTNAIDGTQCAYVCETQRVDWMPVGCTRLFQDYLHEFRGLSPSWHWQPAPPSERADPSSLLCLPTRTFVLIVLIPPSPLPRYVGYPTFLDR